MKQIDENSLPDTRLLGYILSAEEQTPLSDNLTYLGSIENAETVIDNLGITDIFVSLSIPSYYKIHSLITKLVNSSYNVWIIDGGFEQKWENKTLNNRIDGSPKDSPLKPLSTPQRIIKRFFDLAIGLILQILSLPLMGMIALIVKLDSPGPAIFKQLRVGENGRLFQIYKFRTMVAGAEEYLGEDLPNDQNGQINHKIPDDPRVTRVGRFLRKTSLDELPQFMNVLNGDMSLVGPRPELPIIVAGYAPWQYNRFIVPQGLTGWWQVNGRSDRPMHLHTEDDIYYIRNYSFLFDISIIARTIWVILKGIGAY